MRRSYIALIIFIVIVVALALWWHSKMTKLHDAIFGGGLVNDLRNAYDDVTRKIAAVVHKL